MSADLSLKLDPQQLAELSAVLHGNEPKLRKYAAQSLNRAVRKGATSIRRALAREMGVPVRTLGSNTGKGRSTKSAVRPLLANSERLNARVRLLNFNLKMIDTQQTPTKGGQYHLGRYDTLHEIDNSPFQQTMQSGHLGWFVRYGDPRKMTRGSYEGRVRQPIKEIYASSPRKIWEANSGMASSETQKLQAFLVQELGKLIHRLAEKDKQ